MIFNFHWSSDHIQFCVIKINVKILVLHLVSVILIFYSPKTSAGIFKKVNKFLHSAESELKIITRYVDPTACNTITSDYGIPGEETGINEKMQTLLTDVESATWHAFLQNTPVIRVEISETAAEPSSSNMKVLTCGGVTVEGRKLDLLWRKKWHILLLPGARKRNIVLIVAAVTNELEPDGYAKAVVLAILEKPSLRKLEIDIRKEKNQEPELKILNYQTDKEACEAVHLVYGDCEKSISEEKEMRNIIDYPSVNTWSRYISTLPGLREHLSAEYAVSKESIIFVCTNKGVTNTIRKVNLLWDHKHKVGLMPGAKRLKKKMKPFIAIVKVKKNIIADNSAQVVGILLNATLQNIQEALLRNAVSASEEAHYIAPDAVTLSQYANLEIQPA